MPRPVHRFLYWSPRILGLLFTAFSAIFALGVFGLGLVWWETLLALAMHLIPTALIALLLAVAWRWEWVGGVLLTAAGLLYTVWARGEGWADPVAVPLMVIGLLFLVGWRDKKVGS